MIVHYWITYDTKNSGLPNNDVWRIAVDNNNVKWITTKSGLAKFDGTNWTVYDSSNSPMPNKDYFMKIEIDKNGNKWIGTDYHGLIKFDDNNWIVYDTSNSDLKYNSVKDIAIDSCNNIWIASSTWPLKINNENWTFIDNKTYNSPINSIRSIAVEPNGVIWFADAISSNKYGVARWDGTNWKYLKQGETPLPASPTSIEIDRFGNKWFLTNYQTNDYGLIVY